MLSFAFKEMYTKALRDGAILELDLGPWPKTFWVKTTNVVHGYKYCILLLSYKGK